MSVFAPLPNPDPAYFLKIAGQGAGLQTHAELWRWLQGDVQTWLAHDVMLIGWGDFQAGQLYYDVVSSLPGVRTHLCTAAGVSPLISYLRDCWAAAQHLPCQIDISGCAELLHRGGAPVPTIAAMQTAFVHGIRDRRDCSDRVYAALSRQPFGTTGSGNALKLLVPFIDTALRQMPTAPVRHPGSGRGPLEAHAARLAILTERERQIMVWVAMGKTNPEIGCILRISEFTVKNHMKSIFGKMDVTNRAQAVAKLTLIGN